MFPDSSYIPEDVIDMNDGATITVPYTYSVYFREEPDVQWGNRWDLYFSDQTDSSWTHWLAIVNSVIISSILGAICIVIWGRTIQGDVRGRGDGALEEARTRTRKAGSGEKKKTGAGLLDKISEAGPDEDLSSDDESLEELTGWKMLHADVFRPPQYGPLLAPLIGSGMQLVFMLAGLLLLSALGVLNPSWRGGFGSVGIGLFIFAGGFSGYFSSRVYKTFGGTNWRKNTLMVSARLTSWELSKLTNFTDCHLGARTGLLFALRPQPLCLGSGVKYRYSIHYTDCSHLPLGDCPGPSCLSWVLHRLFQIPGMGTSHTNISHSSTDSCRTLVYTQFCSDRHCCWTCSFCRPLYRAPLRDEEPLAGQIRLLLRLWLFEHRLGLACDHDSRGYHYHHIPATLR